VSGYLRRLATTGAAYTAASILSKLIAVALLPLYTRYLTPADYGAAEVMFAAVVSASIVIRFGTVGALLRFYYKDGEDPARVVSTSFAVLFWLSTAAALIALPFAGPISEALLDRPAPDLARIAIGGLWVATLHEYLLTLFRLEERARAFFTVTIANVLAAIALTVVLVVGEGSHDPAREQPHAGDDEGAAGDEPGDDRGVDPARLAVVADRIRERRPGQLEAADQHVDRLGELDRQRVEAGLGEPDRADDDDPVDEVEQVERELGRHRRQAEAGHPPQQRGVDPEREPAPVDDDQAEHEDGAAEIAAEQQTASPLALADDQDHGQRDRRQHVGDRHREEGAGALLEPEQGEQVLVQSGHPEAADRDPGQVRSGPVEQRFGDRPGERQRDQRRRGREPEERREGGRDDPRRVLAVLVVEAQQRPDRAEADHDAGRDNGGEHHLGGAVVGRGQVARVERQQRDRDQLREDARRGVGGAGRR